VGQDPTGNEQDMTATRDGSVCRGAGIVLIGVAALVVLANVLVRLGLQSERDREREQRNRRPSTAVRRFRDR
jgi:hypothetical protein